MGSCAPEGWKRTGGTVEDKPNGCLSAHYEAHALSFTDGPPILSDGRLNFRGSGTTRGFENEQHWDSHSKPHDQCATVVNRKGPRRGHGLSAGGKPKRFMEELLSGRRRHARDCGACCWALNQRAVSVDEYVRVCPRLCGNTLRLVFFCFRMSRRPTGLVDTCGTGGDETGTFNN